ncbi:major facilitator superfamily domain-containing protein [Lasiosphaeris hirsuta]|uniref:Major facilitator superfamily domain-containing protein n=1 Tax=Lasiosphaeris hirsuta TaxID=260670 RepID=A0AA40EA42_9PEZI|nr:major facilitator superfamily domain-containing protein [Lasiosphaeris hirsuta]
MLGPQLPGGSDTVNVPECQLGSEPWKVVIGCFCLTVPIYGLLSSIGLFQTYWRNHQLSDYSESEVSWIISMFGFLDCFFGGPSGILFDRYGVRWLLPLASIVYVASFIGLGFSSTYGQFMGCLSVAGMSAAIPTTIAFAVVSQWFSLREGIATGFVTLGAAVGGIFFSLILQVLFDHFAWKTSALALSGVVSGFMLVGNMLVETNVSRQGASEKWDFAELWSLSKSLKFWLISYAFFAYELVLFIQWGSIPTYAVSVGVGSNQFHLMMSYNVGAILGRTIPLWVSDGKLGPLNTIILMNIFTLLTAVAVWLPFGASSIQALYVVVVLMGIGTGSFVPLGVACVSALCEPESTGTWLGSVYSFAGFATLIGNPSTGAILARYKSHGLVAFLAAVLFSGLVSATALRWLCHGRRWIVRKRI